jgi:flagellum-specific peptidoglycan hydrolase FlgJ
MRSKPKRQFIAYLLIMTLFLTMDMSFETKNKHYADASSNLSLDTNLITNFTSFSLWKTSMMTHPEVTIKKEEEEPQHTVEALENESAEKESTLAKYEVTAYYLNIRLNTSDMSKIIKVIPKGTVLEILNTTDNGWLILKSGGYVNGKYTKPIDSNFNHTPLVKALSMIHTKNIGGADNKPTASVKSDSGLTDAHIEKLFKGTSLQGHGLEKVIIEMEEDYGINAYFTIAVMKLESANGKSNLSKNKNNLFGLNAIDGDKHNKAFSFKTKGDSVRKFGQLISKHYLGEGYTTVEKVSRKYCQANPKWSSLVISIMNSDYKKLQQA